MVTTECGTCGKLVTDHPSSRRRFCSRACAYEAIRGKRTGHTHIDQLGGQVRISTNQPSLWVLVDEVDAVWAGFHAWHIHSGYARTHYGFRRGGFPMHRAIMERMLGRKLKPNERVDHVNRVRHDNRRENLRLARPAENSWNIGVNRRNRSGYIGVHYARASGRYRATIVNDHIYTSIGYFDTALEAAYVRDQFALQMRGEYAALNVL